MSTKFDINSSMRFSFSARTHMHTDRQTHRITDASDHPTHAPATGGVRRAGIPREQFPHSIVVASS